MTTQKDRIEAAIRHIQTSVDIDPWAMELAVEALKAQLPSAKPDDRLAKIADLVEGTIDHFDLDDAMDLLYQIKEVLK